ncbi:MAG: transglutaminase-like domain-containing protein, partial [Planctomycetota bacterium]
FGPLAFDERTYRKELDTWAEEAAPGLRRKNGERLLRELNRFLFEEKGLRPDREEYEDPDNGLLNRVLDRRAGIELTLSTLTLLLARRLDLPISGIGMPGHFLLRYDGPDGEIYFDPYDRGRLLSKADCIGFLMASGFDFENAYLFPSPNREILTRMIDHLESVYRTRKITSRQVRLLRCRKQLG